MCFKTRGLYKCGKCPECLQERRNDWAIRLIQESRLFGCFSALLTYRPEDVPLTKDLKMSVKKTDVQKFLKRFRQFLKKHYGIEKIKYYIASEYSPQKMRPHYHCLFFGLPKNLTANQIKEVLQKTWQLGFIGSYSNWLKDDAQVNYALGYLMQLYEFPEDDTRERPFQLFSKGLALEYIPCEGIHRNYPKGKYGWVNVYTGEFTQDSPVVELDSPFYNHDIKVDFLHGPDTVPHTKIKYMPQQYLFVSPLEVDLDNNITVADDFITNIDTVSLQQTHFNPRTRQTTLGSIQSFKMPRRWRENCLTRADRDIINAIKAVKAHRDSLKYLEEYGDYDNNVDFPYWKQIKYQRWKQKKKNKKDKLLNNPDSFL